MKRVLVLLVILSLVACHKIVEVNGHQIDTAAAALKHVQIASEYFKTGDLEHTHANLQRALDLNPDCAAAYSLQGVVLEREGDIDAAGKSYARAVSLDGAYSPGRNNYGVFLYRQGNYRDAVKQLRVAADDLGYEGRGQALVNLGRALVKTGDSDAAQTAFERSLVLLPNAPDALFELASLQYAKGNMGTAHDLYLRYVSVLKDKVVQDARSLWLGIRLERQFGNTDALGSYELALKHLYPDSPEYKAYLESKQ